MKEQDAFAIRTNAMGQRHVEHGKLTTTHAASTYGLPVFVRHDDGAVLEATEVTTVAFDWEQSDADSRAFAARIRQAGYAIEALGNG